MKRFMGYVYVHTIMFQRSVEWGSVEIIEQKQTFLRFNWPF